MDHPGEAVSLVASTAFSVIPMGYGHCCKPIIAFSATLPNFSVAYFALHAFLSPPSFLLHSPVLASHLHFWGLGILQASPVCIVVLSRFAPNHLPLPAACPTHAHALPS
eukprot:EG_transcript_28207